MTVNSSISSVAVVDGFRDGDWVESKDQDPDGDIRLLQLADVGDGYFSDRSDRRINDEAYIRLNCSPVQAGDVLIARMPDPLGRACIVPPGIGRAITAVDVAILRCDVEKVDRRYVMYAINAESTRSLMKSFQDGATRQRISRKRLGRTQIPLPELRDQRAVADYLDRETAQLDTLIGEQRRLIGMLGDRLVSSITQAATRGLNDDPIVDSGNVCLGEVPAHWTVSRFSREMDLNGGQVDHAMNHGLTWFW